MEAILMFLILISGLLAVGIAALAWGVDSRGSVPDDHAR
jgi:nitrogen fixation-related uncharacterized protein